MPNDMRLIIVSGLSGAGKSVALHVLEDLGYYCIDNLPAALLKSLVNEVSSGTEQQRAIVWRSVSMRAIDCATWNRCRVSSRNFGSRIFKLTCCLFSPTTKYS